MSEPSDETHHSPMHLIAGAIRERRVLSVTYRNALEPQMFAPVWLYETRKRLMVDGWEISGRRVQWRELEVAALRQIAHTEHTFKVDPTLEPLRKTPPPDTAFIATLG